MISYSFTHLPPPLNMLFIDQRWKNDRWTIIFSYFLVLRNFENIAIEIWNFHKGIRRYYSNLSTSPIFQSISFVQFYLFFSTVIVIYIYYTESCWKLCFIERNDLLLLLDVSTISIYYPTSEKLTPLITNKFFFIAMTFSTL